MGRLFNEKMWALGRYALNYWQYSSCQWYISVKKWHFTSNWKSSRNDGDLTSHVLSLGDAVFDVTIRNPSGTLTIEKQANNFIAPWWWLVSMLVDCYATIVLLLQSNCWDWVFNWVLKILLFFRHLSCTSNVSFSMSKKEHFLSFHQAGFWRNRIIVMSRSRPPQMLLDSIILRLLIVYSLLTASVWKIKQMRTFMYFFGLDYLLAYMCRIPYVSKRITGNGKKRKGKSSKYLFFFYYWYFI